MIRLFATIFASLLGLAFGSFLNVCLSRWPEGESVVAPRSHCRNCTHSLAWWENIPLFSWIALRGRCRQCRTWIGWRYPLIEFLVGLLWAARPWLLFGNLDNLCGPELYWSLIYSIGAMIFYWLLIALACLDAENLWLPDWLTLPGVALGFVFSISLAALNNPASLFKESLHLLGSICFAAGLILIIRGLYWLIRKREGLGLGDAKLMALLAAWLGLPQALLSMGIGVLLGALAALFLLALPAARRESESWAQSKLPLGTFLCIGGIVSSLWGQPILNAYMRWAGF